MEDISIHALREEGDSATTMCRTGSGYFYPRPPRGGRRWDREGLSTRNLISIHALREEGDRPAWMLGVPGMRFLSTPSARRATIRLDVQRQGERQISIHALREEGDCPASIGAGRGRSISIHALREEGDSKNGEKHLRFCFIIKRSAQIWKSFSKNIRKKSRDLHRMP